VEVSDAGAGKLNVEVTYPEGGAKFVNQYHADGKIEFSATKEITGNRAQIVQADEFTFTVTEDGEEVATGATLLGGVVKFTEISYDQDDIGTHEYVITEDKGSDETIGYKAEPVTVTVEVSDAGEGKLNTVATYPEGGARFVNQYYASGSVDLTAVTELTGNRAAEIGENEFTFIITENGKEVANGETLAGGEVKFTEIAYTQDEIGTHTYVITEDKGTNDSIDYTAEPLTVTVEVSDAGEGKLDAEATYPEGGAEFVNAYHAEGSTTLTAKTELEGSPLMEKQFTFELKDDMGNVLQTTQNAPDGVVTFEDLTYTEEDIDNSFTYTISETDSGVYGVTYSTDLYTVETFVSDNSDGTLTVQTEITKDGQEETEMLFENSFEGTAVLHKSGPDGEVLSGVSFELYQKEEDGWQLYTKDQKDGIYTTDEEGNLKVTGLTENEYYFLEMAAPDGYVTALDEEGNAKKYVFSIGLNDPDAVVDAKLEVVNEKTRVEILKEDEQGLPVKGAVLRIVDTDGQKMDEWTTNGKAHVIKGDLVGGKTYRLIEISAPKGRKIASDIYFTVRTDGATEPIVMVDKKKASAPGSVLLTIDLTLDGDPVIADQASFYAALFADPDCTIRLTDISLVSFDDSYYASAYFDDLEEGTYYVAETDENGNVIDHGTIGEDSGFTAEFINGQKIQVRKDGTTEITFENRLDTLPEGFVVAKAESTEQKEQESDTAKAVKTGDDSLAALYAILLAASSMVLLITEKRRRRRTR
jgi:pilin isopeptide linkage protein